MAEWDFNNRVLSDDVLVRSKFERKKNSRSHILCGTRVSTNVFDERVSLFDNILVVHDVTWAEDETDGRHIGWTYCISVTGKFLPFFNIL